MENSYTVPTIQELIERTEEFNKKYPEYDYGVHKDLLQNVIDILSHSSDFLEFTYTNGYDYYFENAFMIYGELLNFIKYCHTQGNLEEIRGILILLDQKIRHGSQNTIELINTGFLEIMDIYPEILSDIIKLMPKYMKEFFMEHYSEYLSLKSQ